MVHLINPNLRVPETIKETFSVSHYGRTERCIAARDKPVCG